MAGNPLWFIEAIGRVPPFDRRRLPTLPEATLIGSAGLIGLLQMLIQWIVVGTDYLQTGAQVAYIRCCLE